MIHATKRQNERTKRQQGSTGLPPHIQMLTANAPLGFNAGDANLYRYVGNDPTSLTDPSGLMSAKVTKITVVTDRKDIPKAAKDIKFPDLDADDPKRAAGYPADIRNRLGPFKYTAPGKVGGSFSLSFWVVIEGECLGCNSCSAKSLLHISRSVL